MATSSDKPGVSYDAAVADAACRRWEEIAARLSPIIGERGFLALYARSLHLVQHRFPWLVTPNPSDRRTLSAALADSLKRQPPRVAIDAQQALLLTFTRLLNDFIGGALTSRLLQSAPPDDDAEKPAQENSQ